MKYHRQKSPTLVKLENALRAQISEGTKRIEAHTIPDANQDNRSIVALATYAAVNEMAGGVLLLAENLKPAPAYVAVRSMQEGYFNLAYILQDEDDTRLLEFLYRNAARDLLNLKRIKKYLKASKSDKHDRILKQLDVPDTIHELKALANETKRDLIRRHGREFLSSDEPSLWAKVKEYDQTSQATGSTTELALDYMTAYSHFCKYAHLSTGILAAKLKSSDMGVDLKMDDPVYECERALLSAFAYVSDTLILTLRKIGAPADDLLERSLALAEEVELNSNLDI